MSPEWASQDKISGMTPERPRNQVLGSSALLAEMITPDSGLFLLSVKTPLGRQNPEGVADTDAIECATQIVLLSTLDLLLDDLHQRGDPHSK